MEKAKAIAHVKDMYEYMIFREDKEALEALIPELKESEDEKARKWLTNLVENLGDAADEDAEKELEVMRPLALAYLEKQKESPKKELGKYSEEEELAYRLNWVMQDYYKAGKDDEEKEHRFKCYKLFWDALEDENFFEQKEQKTAGWSEEDKDMLNSCISSIEEAKENRYAYKETDGDTSYDHEIAWLKSLRPSWKPSEEQMEALKHTAEWKRYSDPQLFSLYEQLKKLM